MNTKSKPREEADRQGQEEGTEFAAKQAIAAEPQATASGDAPIPIIDLPDHVKANLTNFENTEIDEAVRRLLTEAKGKPVECDRLIQLIWARWKRSWSRPKLMARLRYLQANGHIEKMPGCRSQYRCLLPLMAAADSNQV